jgi:predicted amidophosphoribosyltransferase
MRDRHKPRTCRACSAPLARQEDACWSCGAPVTAAPIELPVARESLPEAA